MISKWMSAEEAPTDAGTEEPTYEQPTTTEAPAEQQTAEEQELNPKLKKISLTRTVAIGIAFLIPGILALGFAIRANSQVLAFIGLGLTLWGAVFLLITPVEYVKADLITATAAPAYETIERILKDLKPKGNGIYIPPYPKDAYLPEHLKGLKESVVFIPTGTTVATPAIEEIAQSKFLLQNPKGICITSPGLGLLTQFEKEIRTSLTRIGLEELCETLPQIILENFQLAKEIEMHPEKGQVQLRITDSIYMSLYRKPNQKSIQTLGCPLISAIASAIAKTTGKPVTIQALNANIDAETIEVTYRIVEG
jgi:hypothetical protein